MESPRLWKATEVYQQLFQRIETIPIQGVSNSRKLVHITSHKSLFLWYVNIAALLFGNNCCFFLALRPILVKNVHHPIWLSLVQGYLGALSGTTILCSFATIRFGSALVFAWNNKLDTIDYIRLGKFFQQDSYMLNFDLT